MSDQESYLDDLLLEDCLDEVFHGGPSPDLAARILKAASLTVDEPAAQDPTPAPTRAEGPVLKPVPLDPDQPFSLPRWAIRLAQASVAAGLLVLLAVLVMPRESQVPAGMIAADNSEFEFEPGVEWPEVQATAGWYVLSDGAPPLTAAESRVEDVKGVVIVKVGDIPNPIELTAMQPWLDQHQVEAQMNTGWIKAGALALCIVSGSAFVDGQYLSAQDVRKGEARKERAEGEKKDDVNREEKAKSELENLREEVADLEARLAEARELENERERRARVERIENALKDKRERIAAIEARINDDDVAKKRREAERRKNAEKDEDAAAKERRESERRKRAEEDAAGKEREAERRKNAEGEDARKKREAERRDAEKRNGRKQ